MCRGAVTCNKLAHNTTGKNVSWPGHLWVPLTHHFLFARFFGDRYCRHLSACRLGNVFHNPWKQEVQLLWKEQNKARANSKNSVLNSFSYLLDFTVPAHSPYWFVWRELVSWLTTHSVMWIGHFPASWALHLPLTVSLEIGRHLSLYTAFSKTTEGK